MFILSLIYVNATPAPNQMQAGWEGARSGVRGQPALQAGLRRQNWESAGGGGASEEAQVTSERNGNARMSCGQRLTAWLHACLPSRFYLEQELRKERERRTTSRQVSIPRKEPRPPESTPKVKKHERKLLFSSHVCVTEKCGGFLLSTVYSRISVSQKGEQPGNPRSRGQIQSQLQPVCTFQKVHL